MRRILGKYLQMWKARRYLRRIEHALALHRRGEARKDGLKVNQLRNRLEIQWQAREIHPWDRNLPPERKSPIFVEQSLIDTEAAITRLFEVLPHVDVIDLTVLEPASGTVIMLGSVQRSSLERGYQLLSVKMRLREIGVKYFLAGSQFEQMNSDYDREPSSHFTAGKLLDPQSTARGA